MNTKWSAWIENAKNLAQILALIAVAGWSYYTFVKPEIFRPDDYRPHIHLEAKLKSLRVLSDLTVVTLGIHVSNKSKRFLRVLASHYELHGFNIFLYEKNPDIKEIADILNKNPRSIMRMDLLPINEYRTISIGRFLPEQWWFAPEETYNYQIVVAVPCNVSVLQMNLMLHHYHANSEIPRGQWVESGGNLWYEIESKKDEKYVHHDLDTRNEHREIEEEYGFRLEILSTQIDIPREPTTDKCSMISSNEYGGNYSNE